MHALPERRRDKDPRLPVRIADGEVWTAVVRPRRIVFDSVHRERGKARGAKELNEGVRHAGGGAEVENVSQRSRCGAFGAPPRHEVSQQGHGRHPGGERRAAVRAATKHRGEEGALAATPSSRRQSARLWAGSCVVIGRPRLGRCQSRAASGGLRSLRVPPSAMLARDSPSVWGPAQPRLPEAVGCGGPLQLGRIRQKPSGSPCFKSWHEAPSRGRSMTRLRELGGTSPRMDCVIGVWSESSAAEWDPPAGRSS